MRYAEHEIGDIVTIETDRFVAYDPTTSPARAIAGPIIALGMIVGVYDVWGRDLEVWIPNYSQIVVGSAKGQTVVVDPNPDMGPRCFVSHLTGSTLTITTGTETQVEFTSELYDVGDWHDNVSNRARLTVPLGADTRRAIFSAQIKWAAVAAAGIRRVSLRKNGGATPVATVEIVATGGDVQRLHYVEGQPVVGDYYEVWVYHTQGANLDIVGLLEEYSSFSVASVA